MEPSRLRRTAIAALLWSGTRLQMSPTKRRIAAVTDSTAHLVAELRELDELREQVRRALLFSTSSRRLRRRGRKRYHSRRFS